MNLFEPDIITAEDDTAFAAVAAGFFIRALEKIASPLVVLPTGKTPLGLYDVLSHNHVHRRDLWNNLRFLALDEYAGLSAEDHRLFSGWLSRAFLDRAGVPELQRIFFQSDAPDPALEVLRIREWLARHGPVDIAVLGLGENGHIAFNEPGSAFDQPARLVHLTEKTIAANAAYWGGNEDLVPRTAYTLGLGDLAQARQTILLVSGSRKAAILDRVLHGPVTTGIPATYLRTIPNVTIIADRAALKHRP